MLPEHFEIVLSRQALAYYQKIPKGIARRIDRAFLLLEQDPFSGGDIKKLSGKEKRFRLRVGALRIIFTVDQKSFKILVSTILPRGDVYKNI